MTTDHGGVPLPQKFRPIKSPKPSRRRTARFDPLDTDSFNVACGNQILKRKVREIVTVSGRGVRGHFPSYKGKLLKYESLVEEDTLRVAEIAGLVSRLITQPCVLELTADDKHFRYTPDILVTIDGRDYFVEVKANRFVKNADTVSRMRSITAHMRRENTPFILIIENDVRADGLQDELKLLLRSRPAPGRFDPDIDSRNWDPRNLEASNPELIDRWRRAQKICDALIARVMHRDPDSLFETL